MYIRPGIENIYKSHRARISRYNLNISTISLKIVTVSFFFFNLIY